MSRLWTLVGALVLGVAAGPDGLVDDLAHESLPVHMLQHVLLTAAGAVGLAALRLRLPPTAAGLGWARALSVAVVGTVGFWHVPAVFGWGMGSPAVHGIMHVSYIAVGAALVLAIPRLSGGDRLVLLLTAQTLMMLLVLAMISRAVTYPFYPGDHAPPAAVVMLVGMQLGWVVVPAAPALGRLWRRAPALRAGALLGLLGVVAAGGWT